MSDAFKQQDIRKREPIIKMIFPAALRSVFAFLGGGFVLNLDPAFSFHWKNLDFNFFS
jgi:hypothetical protein